MNPCTIVVVDDDDDIIDMITLVLGAGGYRVLPADSGAALRKLIDKGRPDAVMLDIMMDSLTEGLSLCEELRHNPTLTGVPLILMSSIEQDMGFPLNITMLADCYLEKPLDPDELLITIDHFLQHRVGGVNGA